jgi:hypothetical protein
MFRPLKAIVREAVYKGIQIQEIIVNGAICWIKYYIFSQIHGVWIALKIILVCFIKT